MKLSKSSNFVVRFINNLRSNLLLRAQKLLQNEPNKQSNLVLIVFAVVIQMLVLENIMVKINEALRPRFIYLTVMQFISKLDLNVIA